MKYPQGTLIKMLRGYCGLTLVELGKRTGLSITALSKLEHGEQRVVSQKYADEVFVELLKAMSEKQSREKLVAEQNLAKARTLARQVAMDEALTGIADVLVRALQRERDKQIDNLDPDGPQPKGGTLAKAFREARNKQVAKEIESAEKQMADQPKEQKKPVPAGRHKDDTD